MSRFLDLKHAETAYEMLMEANQRNINEIHRLLKQVEAGDKLREAQDAEYFKLSSKVIDYESTLTSIACFHEGATVTGSFDEPGAAKEARAALAKHGITGKPTAAPTEQADEPHYETKSIYLKHPNEEGVIGLHETGYMDGPEWLRMEAWGNQYEDDGKFKYSAFRIFGPIDEDAASMKEGGWTEVPGFDEKVSAMTRSKT